MKKNVASQVIGAQMVSATDGSAFTGTVTVYVTGNAGTQAIGSVGSGVCTHEGNGFHAYAPSQAETNYDHVAFTFIGTGAVPSTIQIFTAFPQSVDNATNIAAIKTKTDSLTFTVANVLDANALRLGGTTQTGRDIGASVLLSPGTGTGQLSLSSGLVTLAAVTHTGAVIPTVTTLTGHTAQTGDAYARLGAPAGASVSADVAAAKAQTAAIETDTQDIQSRLPAALVGGRIDASAGALASGLDLTATMKASVNTEADTALSDVGLTTTITGRIDVASSTRLASASYTAPDNTGIGVAATVAARLNDTLEDDGGTYRFTANALEEAPSGTGASAASIAAALFTVDTGETEATAVAGSVVYEIVQNAGGGSAPSASDNADAVRLELATELARIDAAISTRMASYTQPSGFLAATFPSDPADQSLVIAATDALAALIAAIKAKTDNLPASPAATGDVPSAAANAAALLASAVEGAVTVLQSLRLQNAAAAGKALDMGTSSPRLRDLADTKNRISVTGADEHGNRPTVTRDLT